MPRFVDDAGNVWEATGPKDPDPVFVSGPQGGAQMPANPAFDFAGPKAQADAARAQADARVATSTVEAEIRRANAEAQAAQAQANRLIAESNAGARLTPGQQAADQAFAKDYAAWTAGGGMAGLESKLRVLDEALETIEASDTITGPVFGRLPKFIQQMVNPDSQDVRADVERAIQETLRQTLGAQFTQKEGEGILARTFDPTQNEESNARRMRNLIRELRSSGAAKDSASRYFEQHGTISGWTAPKLGERPNAMTMPRAVRSGAPGAAGYGATTGTDQYPPEMVAAHEQLVNRLLQQGGGRLDPQAYAQARSQLNREFGFEGDEEADLAWANRVNEYLDQGGSSVPAGITPPERELSPAEQLDNNIVSHPLGSAAAGLMDTGSFGVARALNPEAMQAVSELNPTATMLGQMAGGIGGATMLGRAGSAIAGRAAPQLLQGGARGQFGRNLATDAAYGGAYGGMTEGDPLTGAALGTVGSAGGQALGRAAGAAVGGINLSPAAQALKDRGVRLTGGRMLGNAASAIEDRATSIPIVGDMIRRRSAESFEDFNRAAFEEAGKPIGYKPSMIGEVGIEQFQNAVGDAYESATSGVNAPLDDQFVTDMAGAIQRAQNLPPDLRRGLGEILDARVNPINDAGALTGKAYQQAMRALKASRSKPPARFEGFEQEYRDVVSGVMDALTAQAQRGGGQSTIDGLAAANAANRNLKILEDASLDRAKIGTQTGEAEVFLPSQLIAAARKSEKKFGPSTLKQLGKEGQAVLPSTVPNSGTADRAMQFAIGAGALGGGAASDAAFGTDIVNPYTLGAAGLLAAGGTRAGQNLTGAILNSRPAAARQLGQAIRKRKGLFGSAAVPLLVAN